MHNIMYHLKSYYNTDVKQTAFSDFSTSLGDFSELWLVIINKIRK